MVPIPSVVKISNNSACGARPSMTVAEGTPACTARRQASIFGTMPEARLGSMAASRLARISVITSMLFGQSAYRPATSVSTISFSAPSSAASAAAAVSALTL